MGHGEHCPGPGPLSEGHPCPDWPLWKVAIDAELEQLGARKAFTFQPKRMVGDHLLITTTWVFTVKDTVDPVSGATLLKLKARLTACSDLVDPARQAGSPTVNSVSAKRVKTRPRGGNTPKFRERHLLKVFCIN